MPLPFLLAGVIGASTVAVGTVVTRRRRKGTVAGAVAGGLAGSAIPLVGPVAGAAIGAVAGAVAGGDDDDAKLKEG